MDAFDIVLKAGKVFDTGLDLYLTGAVSEDHLGGSAYHSRVKDKTVRNVLIRDRGKGKVQISCDCSAKDMGCRHCAAALMFHCGMGRMDTESLKRRIHEFSDIDTRYGSHRNLTPAQARKQEWEFIYDCIVRPPAEALIRAIDYSIDDEWERMQTFRLITEMTEDRFKGVEHMYLCDLIEGHTHDTISEDVRERFYNEL